MTGTTKQDGYDTCGATNRSGKGNCRRPAGWGTNHTGVGRCKLHGGSTPTHVKAAHVALAKKQLAEAVNALNLPTDIAPDVALLEEVAYTATTVAYLREVVARLEQGDMAGLLVSKVTKDGEEQTASVNVWMRVYGEWVDRKTRVAKMALDAGIAERQVRILEEQAAVFVRVLNGVLVECGVEMSMDTLAIVRRHMLSLDVAE